MPYFDNYSGNKNVYDRLDYYKIGEKAIINYYLLSKKMECTSPENTHIPILTCYETGSVL